MTHAKAHQWIRRASVVAYVIAGLDAFFWFLVVVTGVDFPIGRGSGLDAILFTALGLGLTQRNRFAAIILPLYWAATKVMLWLRFQRVSALIGLLLIGYIFLEGARAVFALRVEEGLSGSTTAS